MLHWKIKNIMLLKIIKCIYKFASLKNAGITDISICLTLLEIIREISPYAREVKYMFLIKKKV